MTDDRFSYSKMKLETITPICIASGRECTPIDYIFDEGNKIVCFLDKHKWGAFILQHDGWLDSYLKYICGNNGEQKNLADWLASKNCSIEDVRKSGAILGECKAKTERKTLNNVSWHTRQGDGSVFIPGSSIKGYIRTAVLYDLLQKNPDVKKKYWAEVDALMDKIENNIFSKLEDIIVEFENKREDYREEVKEFGYKESRYKKYEADVAELNERFKPYISGKECLKNSYIDELDKIGKRLEKELLCKLDFSSVAGKNNSDELETLADVMRGISVSDAVSEKAVTTEVLPKNDLIYNHTKTVYVSGIKHVNGPTYEHNPATNAECITPRNTFYFDLKVDRAVTSSIGIVSVDDVINACETFTTDITKKYKSVFQSLYPKIFGMGKVNLNLGSHTGLLRKTIFLALAPNDEKGFIYMSALLDISFAQILSKTRNQNGEPVPARPWMPRCLRYCCGNERVKLFAPRAIKVFPFGNMPVDRSKKPNPNDLLAGMALMTKLS